jgi:F0F1-type ATP synthase membrane subunit b/b'
MRVVLSALLAAGMAFAAEKEAKGEDDGLGIWRTANFVLLAVGLGYLAGKFGGPFLAARSEDIRRAKAEAQAVRRDAEEKAAAVDARLANLEADIAALRQGSEREIKAETERMAQAVAATLAKVEATLQRETGAAAKAATLELKRHAASLALELAEQKVRARLSPQTEDALVQGFVTDLDRRPRPGNSN